jgi:hypothetical protein
MFYFASLCVLCGLSSFRHDFYCVVEKIFAQLVKKTIFVAENQNLNYIISLYLS